MKKLLVGMIVLLSVVAVVNAQEAAPAAPQTQMIDGVDVTLDLTYTTKYIWRGFNLFGSQGALQPSVNFAFENGFSANIWASYATGSGYVNATEYDYTLAYSNSILDDVYQTNYTVGWRYYDYIDTQSRGNDLQELFAVITMPNLVGNGFTPHAGYFQMWNARSYSGNVFKGGSIFLAGFDYDFTLDAAPELPMTFTWDIVYNDGVGIGVDSDLSHMVWGLKTAMECPMGGKIVPAVYFQNSFEDTVNTSDELWASLSYSYTF